MKYPLEVLFKLKTSDTHRVSKELGWVHNKEYTQKSKNGLTVTCKWDGEESLQFSSQINNEREAELLAKWIQFKVITNISLAQDSAINPDWDYEIHADSDFIEYISTKHTIPHKK